MSLPDRFRLRFRGLRLRAERFSSQHVPAVLAMEHVCFPFPWSEELLYQEAGFKDYTWNLVVRIDDELRAFFFNWILQDEMHLLNFAVHPDWQGKGLGGFLLDWMLAEAAQGGYQSIKLEVRESNRKAIALYESRGFELLLRHKGYYMDSGENALIMIRLLESPESPEGPKRSQTPDGRKRPPATLASKARKAKNSERGKGSDDGH